MALLAVILAVVPVVRDAMHPAAASAAEPGLFNANAVRSVMSEPAVEIRNTLTLVEKSGRSSAKESKKAKKEAAKEKLSRFASKAVGQEDTPVYQKVSDAQDEQIKSDQYEIMGLSSVTPEQMVAHYNAHATYPSTAMKAGGAPEITDFVQIICDEASLEGVRCEVVYAQAMLESGWLKFGGDDSITQYNFAGLGTVGDGNHGNTFPDVRTGIRAQVQHLKAYASTEALVSECVDTRFDMIPRGCAPYVQWLGINENPYGIGWAGGKNYGNYIMKMIVDIRSM